MDKKGGNALSKYQKNLMKSIKNLTPWTLRRRTAKYAGRVKPGEIVVELGENDMAQDYWYKDADIINAKTKQK